MDPDLAAVMTINDFHKDSMKQNFLEKNRGGKSLLCLFVDCVNPDAPKATK